MPTLVLSGEGDELVPPANGVQLARLLPESRLHVIADEGHLMVFDPESGALPLLEDFFSSPVLDACTSVDDGGLGSTTTPRSSARSHSRSAPSHIVR